jgi:hypothetical protein
MMKFMFRKQTGSKELYFIPAYKLNPSRDFIPKIILFISIYFFGALTVNSVNKYGVNLTPCVNDYNEKMMQMPPSNLWFS